MEVVELRARKTVNINYLCFLFVLVVALAVTILAFLYRDFSNRFYLISKEKKVTQPQINTSNKKIKKSFELLKNTSLGEDIVEHLVESNVKIVFGKPKTTGAAAVFVPNFLGNSGTIIINSRLRDEDVSVSAIAAILAHEGKHAQMSTILGYDSVEQEYKCYIVQAKVWRELWFKANADLMDGLRHEIPESSPENDYAVEIKKMVKFQAFNQIYEDYYRIGVDLPLE